MASFSFNIEGSRLIVMGEGRSICVERLDNLAWDATRLSAGVVEAVARIYLDQLKAFYDVELIFTPNPEQCSELQALGSVKKIHQLLFPQAAPSCVIQPAPKPVAKNEGTPLWKVGASLRQEAARFARQHSESFLAELNYDTSPLSDRIVRAFAELIDSRRKKKRSEDAEALFQWILQMSRRILKECGGNSAAACNLAVHLLPLCLEKDASRLLEDLGSEPWQQ